MAGKQNDNKQVYYKNRNVRDDTTTSSQSRNDSILDPSGLIAEAGSPKAYYFPNNLSSYAAGNILRFSIFKYQGGGYKANLEATGGADAIADLPVSEKIADIYLPEPSSGSNTYKPEWQRRSLGSLAAFATTGMSIKNLMQRKSFTDDSRSILYGQGISQAIGALANLAHSVSPGSAQVAADTFQVTGGLYMQEYKETLFNGISPRSFNYVFNLVPRSPYDLILISNIIQLFKWAAVPGLFDIPTKSGGSMKVALTTKLFESPDIIQIRHMTKVKGNSGSVNLSHETIGVTTGENDLLEINPWVSKHLPSILENVTINYGSDKAQYFMTYVQERSIDPDSVEEISLGAPLMYTLSLTFSELTVLTKSAINNGY